MSDYVPNALAAAQVALSHTDEVGAVRAEAAAKGKPVSLADGEMFSFQNGLDVHDLSMYPDGRVIVVGKTDHTPDSPYHLRLWDPARALAGATEVAQGSKGGIGSPYEGTTSCERHVWMQQEDGIRVWIDPETPPFFLEGFKKEPLYMHSMAGPGEHSLVYTDRETGELLVCRKDKHENTQRFPPDSRCLGFIDGRPIIYRHDPNTGDGNVIWNENGWESGLVGGTISGPIERDGKFYYLAWERTGETTSRRVMLELGGGTTPTPLKTHQDINEHVRYVGHTADRLFFYRAHGGPVMDDQGLVYLRSDQCPELKFQFFSGHMVGTNTGRNRVYVWKTGQMEPIHVIEPKSGDVGIRKIQGLLGISTREKIAIIRPEDLEAGLEPLWQPHYGVGLSITKMNDGRLMSAIDAGGGTVSIINFRLTNR